MKEVWVEAMELANGALMAINNIGRRIRLIFDPRRITVDTAVRMLCDAYPHLAGNIKIIHAAPA